MPNFAGNATSMLRLADEMAQNATSLRRLANAIGSAPEPLGHHVIALASVLSRYDICLITRDALKTLQGFVETFDADESDHPREAACNQALMLKAIEQSLQPAQWLSREGGAT